VKLYRLERTQFLPIDVSVAWDFFSDPRNLSLITPPDLGFRIISDLPDRMYAGMLVTYTVTPFPPFRVRWVTEITRAEEPSLFVDEQRFGPYRFWHHQHLFRPVQGGVEMRDIVSYVLPFGPLGRLVAPWVTRRVAGIFDFRRDYLARRFEIRYPKA